MNSFYPVLVINISNIFFFFFFWLEFKFSIFFSFLCKDIIRSCKVRWFSLIISCICTPFATSFNIDFCRFNRAFFALKHTCKYSIVIGAIDKNCLCKQYDIINVLSNGAHGIRTNVLSANLTVGEKWFRPNDSGILN